MCDAFEGSDSICLYFIPSPTRGVPLTEIFCRGCPLLQVSIEAWGRPDHPFLHTPASEAWKRPWACETRYFSFPLHELMASCGYGVMAV